MYRGSGVLLCLNIILVTVQKIESFAEDYYFRSNFMDCDTDDFNFACSAKCKSDYTCMFGRCFCLIDPKDKGRNKIDLVHNNVIFYKNTLRQRKPEDSSSDSRDDSDYDYDRTYSTDKPALRHHIAHFCENLDTARECIRTCIKQGKPAFCGKDHTCYCGHKYPDTHSSNESVDANEMYAAFQDLYAKYFGTTESNIVHDADSDDDAYSQLETFD